MKTTIFYFFIILVISSAVPAFAAAQTFNRNLYYGLTNDTDVQALQQFLARRRATTTVPPLAISFRLRDWR